MARLGVELAAVAPGRCVPELACRPGVGQQHGCFHGGVIGAVADSAAGHAAFSLTPPDTSVLTVGYRINFLAPARGSRLIARGRVLRAGATLIVARAAVAAVGEDDETPRAAAQATVMALPARPGRLAGQRRRGARRDGDCAMVGRRRDRRRDRGGGTSAA